MGASQFVGRVGGLAVALGVGSAVLSGQGTAWADTSAATDPSASSSSSDSAASTLRGRKGGSERAGATVRDESGSQRGPRAGRSDNTTAIIPDRTEVNGEPDPRVAVPDLAAPVTAGVPESVDIAAPIDAVRPAAAVSVPSPAAAKPLSVVEVATAPPHAVVTGDPITVSAAELSAADEPPVSAPVVAPANAVSSIRTAAELEGDTAASDTPAMPADSPLAWSVLAAARRQPLSAAATGTAATPTANAETTETAEGIKVTSLSTVLPSLPGVALGLIKAEGDGLAYTYELLGGSNGGKTFALGPTGGGEYAFAALPYATWLDNEGGTLGTEQFEVRIRELTTVEALLMNVPIIGGLAIDVIHFLQDMPFVGDLLAPLIGESELAEVEFNLDQLAALNGGPLAYTYKVTSFDEVKISTNFFPAAGLKAGGTAPTTIVAPGFGSPGGTNPWAEYALKNEVPGIGTLRDRGYNVITFDPRGSYQSGGVMHMASPDYEGKDVSAIVSWVAEKTPAELNAADDPKIGMVGGSYGGALQLAAARDSRIDAMAPVDSWDTLLNTYYPDDIFKTAYGALYGWSLISAGVRALPQLYVAFATGILFNWLGPLSKSMMEASDPPLDALTSPTLLVRGTLDALVPLAQGTNIAQDIVNNGNDVPLKTIWFNGGHGAGEEVPDDQSVVMNAGTLAWLDAYVRGNTAAADALPTFQWFDQKGVYHSSALESFQDGFNDLPDVEVKSDGGWLGIVPILGGSGPGRAGFPTNLVNGSKASNAINIPVPVDQLRTGTQVVGAPTLSFTYQGLGTGKAIFAQVVDEATGEVLSNLVTPVPVTLNGLQHTATVDIGSIAYTVGEGDSLLVQITSSATAFENPSIGLVKISDVTVTLPNRTA